ncbi:hypothetical protein ACF0H5_003886 [Mactra antiquata]
MAAKRQLVVQHNIDTGAADPKQFSVSFDGRYNANRLTSSYKSWQAASQAYGVAIENNACYQYIIGLAVENKLFWTGAYLRNKGYNIQCPGHTGCTANIPYMQPQSEPHMAYDIAQQLSREDILVKSLTTDGTPHNSIV